MFPKYRDIAAWATRMAADAEKRQKHKSSEYRPATNAGLKNGLLALEGHINNTVGELGAVLSDIFDQKLEAMREWWTVGMNNMRERVEDNIEQLFKTYNQVDEMRHIENDKKAVRRQNVIMSYLVGLAKQVEHNDKQNSERWLKTQETLSMMNAAYQTDHTLMFNTLIATFNSLSEQVQTVRKVVDPEDCGEGPTLKWIKANADAIIQLGLDLSKLKDNDMPQGAARVNAVRSMKALGPFPMLEVRDVVDNVVDLWAKAA